MVVVDRVQNIVVVADFVPEADSVVDFGRVLIKVVEAVG